MTSFQQGGELTSVGAFLSFCPRVGALFLTKAIVGVTLLSLEGKNVPFLSREESFLPLQKERLLLCSRFVACNFTFTGVASRDGGLTKRHNAPMWGFCTSSLLLLCIVVSHLKRLTKS